jgi:hypothetical protein
VLAVVIVSIGTIFLALREKGTVTRPEKQVIAIVGRDLPPYHLITQGDVGHKSINLVDANGGLVLRELELVGRYTLTNVASNEPIKETQLSRVVIDTPQIVATLAATDTLVMGVPADAATTLGWTLQPADIVVISTVPEIPNSEPPQVILDNVLVLDVRSVPTSSVVLVALSPVDWITYMQKTRDAKPVLARRIR